MKEYNDLTLPEAAERYHRAGYVITPCRPMTKRAYLKGWQLPETYESFDPVDWWEKNPNDNIGVVLAPSKLVSLDIDNKDEFILAINKIGLNPEDGELPFWVSPTAGVESGAIGKSKLFFQAPSDVILPHHDLDWTNVEDSTKSHSVFELRSGWNNIDILPPSIRPETYTKYQWVGGDTIEPLPKDLRLLWDEWTMFEPALKRADRFFVEKEDTSVKRGRPRKPYSGRDYIREWIDTNPLIPLLESFGYKRKGSRFSSPSSTRHDTSVIISGDQKTFYCFSVSDHFGDHHQHNAFDLVLHYEHNDNFLEALERVKNDLGVYEIKDNELLEAIKRHGMAGGKQ